MRRVRLALLLFALFLVVPRPASAAIAFVEGCHGQNGNTTTVTATCTVSSVSNLLVLGCHASSTATATFTVDDNGGGHSATQQGTTGSVGTQRGAIFTMTPPSTGSVTFKCTASTSGSDLTLSVGEYSGATGGVLAGTATTGTTSPATASITIANANDWVVNSCGSRGTGVFTTMTSGTLRETDFVSANDRQVGGLGDNTAASGSVTVAFTIPGGDFNYECEPLELELSGGGGGSSSVPLTVLGAGPGQ